MPPITPHSWPFRHSLPDSFAAVVARGAVDEVKVSDPAPPNVALGVIEMRGEVVDPRQRIHGCLLAAAAGDALGAPVEFLWMAEIRQHYGYQGIRDYPRGEGLITDDTQMTMATARALLAAATAVRDGDIDAATRAVYHEYLVWFETQEDPLEQRGPGRTCLSALASGRMGTTAWAINDSKGCGGVMRVAPVGLALPGRPQAAYELGRATAAITHGHPGGQTPSGWLAALVAELVTGADLRATVRSLLRLSLLDDDSQALAAAAWELAGADAAPEEAWQRLGAGWTGDEALAIGLFAALKHPADLEAALPLAVNHSGDSDSTGTICGAILGAHLGLGALPERWLTGLEHRQALMHLADELHEAFWN